MLPHSGLYLLNEQINFLELWPHLPTHLLDFLKIQSLTLQLILAPLDLRGQLFLHADLFFQISDNFLLLYRIPTQSLDDPKEWLFDYTVVEIEGEWVMSRVDRLELIYLWQHLDHFIPQFLVFDIDDDGFDLIPQCLPQSPHEVLIKPALLSLLRMQVTEAVLELLELKITLLTETEDL